MGSIIKEFQTESDDFLIKYGKEPEAKSFYIYCDQCGSFKVEDVIRPVYWVGMAVFLCATGFGWNALIAASHFSAWQPGLCWGAYAIVVLILITRAWSYFGHRCLKCGNTKITNDDPLDFEPRYHARMLDVVESTAHVHRRFRGRWYDDMMLAGFLIVLSLGPLIFLISVSFEFIRKKWFHKEAP